MGVPVVEAPTEAEAQCAEIVKKGKGELTWHFSYRSHWRHCRRVLSHFVFSAWAVGTEDMDALTFGAPVLLRYLTYSEARKKPVIEVYLDKVLEGMGLNMNQFIDLCILMGCDYLPTLPKIGKQRAYDLIKLYGSIEEVLKNLDPEKYPVPEDYNFDGVRGLFKEPDVTPAEDLNLQYADPDVEGVVQFLCVEKGFNEERVRSAMEKMKANKQTTVQNRLTSYFGAPQRKDTPEKKKGSKRDEKGAQEKDGKAKKAKRFDGKTGKTKSKKK